MSGIGRCSIPGRGIGPKSFGQELDDGMVHQLFRRDGGGIHGRLSEIESNLSEWNFVLQDLGSQTVNAIDHDGRCIFFGFGLLFGGMTATAAAGAAVVVFS